MGQKSSSSSSFRLTQTQGSLSVISRESTLYNDAIVQHTKYLSQWYSYLSLSGMMCVLCLNITGQYHHQYHHRLKSRVCYHVRRVMASPDNGKLSTTSYFGGTLSYMQATDGQSCSIQHMAAFGLCAYIHTRCTYFKSQLFTAMGKNMVGEY